MKHPRTEETKKRISKTLKRLRIEPPIEVRGNWLGKHHSPETKKKLSLAKKGKPLFKIRGKNHWNWKNGSTVEAKVFRDRIEHKLWREAVFARDNWTCQKCKKRDGKELNSHHIQNFSEIYELRTSIENGITFCKQCHNKFHKIYERKNNTKEQLDNFLWKMS